MKAFVYEGRRVPWVTRWTSEVIPSTDIRLRPISLGRGDFRIGIEGATAEDFLDDVLWLPERSSPGDGQPMWKDVHSHRQRQAMLEGRCQVCGQVIDPPVTWLIPSPLMMGAHKVPFVQKQRSSLVTDVVPVCMRDLPVALASCPHLRDNPDEISLYEVRGWRPHALFGDVMIRMPSGYRLMQREVELGNAGDLAKVMARQMVVELWDYRRRRM